MHKYAEAEAADREALRLSPADADVLDGLGAAIGEQHRITEAAADFREAVALAPGNAQYRSNLDMAEKMLQKGEH
jgi:protein O-GlcNAc transferase